MLSRGGGATLRLCVTHRLCPSGPYWAKKMLNEAVKPEGEQQRAATVSQNGSPTRSQPGGMVSVCYHTK